MRLKEWQKPWGSLPVGHGTVQPGDQSSERSLAILKSVVIRETSGNTVILLWKKHLLFLFVSDVLGPLVLEVTIHVLTFLVISKLDAAKYTPSLITGQAHRLLSNCFKMNWRDTICFRPGLYSPWQFNSL